MKILFIVSSLGQGGAERVLTLLANDWAVDHEISVLTLRGPEHDFYSLSSLVNRYSLGIERKRWYRFGAHLGIIRGIKEVTDQVAPDYIVSFVIKTNIFVLLARPQAPVIVCEHSILERDDIDLRQELLRKLLYRRAAKIGVLTESIRHSFLRRYPSIEPENVVVLPNPVVKPDIESFHAVEKHELFPGEECRIIISLGRLVPVKNFASLMRAFKQVEAELPDARLVIYGEGPDRANLEELIEQLDLDHTVRLPGLTDNPFGVLSAADLFAVSSRFEGFPMGIVEAMSLGLPCVGYDVPGVRDVVSDKENGLLVPFDDESALAGALTELLTHSDTYAKLSRSAPEVAERYSASAINSIWFTKVFC